MYLVPYSHSLWPSVSHPCHDDWTLTAAWIFPGAQLPLEWGTVTIRGEQIVAVLPKGERTADINLGQVAVLPGLVNPHTHLDLSGLSHGNLPAEDFTAWLRAIIAYRLSLTPEQALANIRAGIAESLHHGTTLLGDIASQGLSWANLAEAPLRAVVFRELLGLAAGRAERAWSDARAWLDDHPSTATCRPGLSPHAPYSVHAFLFRQTAALARQCRLPVAIHLAETLAELELLAHHRGPLADFLLNLGVWEAAGLVPSCQHVLDEFRDLASVLFAHGNYLKPAIHRTRGTIVYCPRTHAYFGHRPHPFRDFMQAGVTVALGTDSRASNPDLNVLTEARFLHQQYPEVPGDVLLRMITLHGARALGWDDATGSLEPGKSADLVVLPLPAANQIDPHWFVFESELPLTRVLWHGQWRAEPFGERGVSTP